MNNKIRVSGIITALVAGILFLSFGAVRTCASIIKFSSYTKVSAVVVDEISMIFHTKHGYKTRYSPLFEYEVNGITYKSQDNKFTDKYRPNGTEITAYYNTENPHEACTEKTDWIGIFFIIFGGIIIVIGFLSCITMRMSNKRI